MRASYLWTALFGLALSASVAQADLQVVQSKSEFVKLIDGKTLTRPLIKLQVSTGGTITGRGARWDVTGTWSWQDGFFCRDLIWGGDALPYNCQEVRANGDKIRFTSDRGTGNYADFRLR